MSKRPTEYHGGKIFWAKSKHARRVHLRKKDRIEEHVKVSKEKKGDDKVKFRLACALIEDDSRPTVA